MANKPLVGKDGNHYRDYYELRAANTRYDQRQKLIEEQQATNRLIKEQNERIKNQMTQNYNADYISSDTRIGIWFLYLSLIIAPILIFSKLSVQYGIYILVAGIVIESISAYKYNRKNQITNHFFEISLLIIAMLCFMITIIPINKIKQFIPIGDGTYTIKIYNYEKTNRVNSVSIDGIKKFPSQLEKLDIDKKITISIDYSEYVNSNYKWINKNKDVEFNPRDYFNNIEKNKTLSSKYLDELYIINIQDILNNY